jgi:hypothetical protein
MHSLHASFADCDSTFFEVHAGAMKDPKGSCNSHYPNIAPANAIVD